jgi:hypothetical protein
MRQVKQIACIASIEGLSTSTPKITVTILTLISLIVMIDASIDGASCRSKSSFM